MQEGKEWKKIYLVFLEILVEKRKKNLIFAFYFAFMIQKVWRFLVVVILLVSTNGIFIDHCSCGNESVSVTKQKNVEWCKCKWPCHHKIKYLRINDCFESCNHDKLANTHTDFSLFFKLPSISLTPPPLKLFDLLFKPPNLSLYYKDFFIEVFRI